MARLQLEGEAYSRHYAVIAAVDLLPGRDGGQVLVSATLGTVATRLLQRALEPPDQGIVYEVRNGGVFLTSPVGVE